MPELPPLDPEAREEALTTIIGDLVAEDEQRDPAALYQDFQRQCRMRGIPDPLHLRDFRRRYAMLRAGIRKPEEWEDAVALAAALPEEMLAPFLAIARAARDGKEGPSDVELARLYGTVSTGRARRMLGFIEDAGLIVTRTDLSGRRSIRVSHLGLSTSASVPDPTRPSRLARIDERVLRRASVG